MKADRDQLLNAIQEYCDACRREDCTDCRLARYRHVTVLSGEFEEAFAMRHARMTCVDCKGINVFDTCHELSCPLFKYQDGPGDRRLATKLPLPTIPSRLRYGRPVGAKTPTASELEEM